MMLRTIDKLYKRLIVISLLSCLIMINISYCGAVPDTLSNQQILAWINNEATEEELRHFNNFLERIGAQNNPNLVLNEELNIPQERFGWESLGIFIGASILGYLFIKHGMAAWDIIRDFLGEVAVHSIDTLRNTAFTRSNSMMSNPIFRDQIINYFSTLQQQRH